MAVYPATAAVSNHWICVVSPGIGEADIQGVVRSLEWPAWIADVADPLRRFTHEVFASGQIQVNRPLTDEEVSRLRVVAMFFEYIGPNAIHEVSRQILGA